MREAIKAARQNTCRSSSTTVPARPKSLPAISGRAARWFEELGFYYVGPIDGHNLDHLLPVLKNVRDAETGPILVHVVTQKGQGLRPGRSQSREIPCRPVPFDVITGTQNKPKANAPSYTKVFADALIAEAKTDDKIVAGDGGDAERHRPSICFDKGVPRPYLRRPASPSSTR